MPSLMPNGKQQYFYPGTSLPLVGGKLYTYAAGTSALKPTYQDAAGTTPNPNPVILDASGAALIFWDGAYKIVLKDALGNTVYTVDNYNADPFGVKSFIASIAASAGSALMGFIQAGAGAVSHWVQDKLRERISVLDFGAKGDGVTDDTAAIQAAANAAAGKALYFPGTAAPYLISAPISLSNNSTVYGDSRGTVIKLATGGISGFDASNVSGVIVRDLTILCAVAGTTAYIGGVRFNNSTKCKAINVECIGMSWSGILITDSSQCVVDGCRFSGWLGTIQDAADIMIYRNSSFNIVRSNECFGGGDHGIFIQDPYANTMPLANIITDNVVGQHNAYGIAAYIALATTAPFDSRTVISNNTISDILGTSISGESGAGIYIQAANGAIVTGNSVINCCRSTTNFDTLAMAGIAFQLGETATGLEVESICSNNLVYSSRGPCFWAAASNRTISVTGNVFKSDTNNNLRGEAVILSNSNAVKFSDNTIRHINQNFYAVKLTVNGPTEYSNHQITNNVLNATGSVGGYLVDGNAGTMAHVLFSGNTVYGTLATPCFQFAKVSNVIFTNNQGDSSGIVFILNNCPNSRLSNNRLYSSSAGYAILFTGNNGKTVVDESNDLQGPIENDAGNGTRITLYGDTAPAQSGLWDIGDTVINRSPSGTGVPDRWRCIAAGYPATWKPVLLS